MEPYNSNCFARGIEEGRTSVNGRSERTVCLSTHDVRHFNTIIVLRNVK